MYTVGTWEVHPWVPPPLRARAVERNDTPRHSGL